MHSKLNEKFDGLDPKIIEEISKICAENYNQGNADGYTKGYADGVGDGYKGGYKGGYSDGHTDG